jgi:hypothetical protein
MPGSQGGIYDRNCRLSAARLTLTPNRQRSFLAAQDSQMKKPPALKQILKKNPKIVDAVDSMDDRKE